MRKTSDVTDARFPFASDRTPFILVVTEPVEVRLAETKDGRGFEQASTHDKKFALLNKAYELREAGAVATLLAVWPGKGRSDVFEVDDLSAAMSAMGATPERES